MVSIKPASESILRLTLASASSSNFGSSVFVGLFVRLDSSFLVCNPCAFGSGISVFASPFEISVLSTSRNKFDEWGGMRAFCGKL